MIDLSGLISVPATIEGNKHVSAVLEHDAKFGIASALAHEYAISYGEAYEISVRLVRHSGRRVETLLTNADWNWDKADTAFRDAYRGAIMAIATK